MVVFKNRDTFFTVYGADWQAWSNIHGIEPVTTKCDSCGNSLTTNVPIATKELRGLKSETCKCGDNDVPFCYVNKI